MADEMKELRGAVFDLIPDGVSVVALDEIEVDDMAPKTRNVKDEDSNKQHRVDDERFGGLVYKLPGVVFCQIEVVQNGVSIQSEKAAGFSPVERKDPPPLLFGFYPIRAWVRLYDSPSNLIILP